jgi:ribosomal protein S9
VGQAGDAPRRGSRAEARGDRRSRRAALGSFLTRDSRMVERKKYGSARRRRFQFSKR